MVNGFVKSKARHSRAAGNHLFLSFPRRRESREIKEFWTPAFAGVTDLGTFYEFIIIDE